MEEQMKQPGKGMSITALVLGIMSMICIFVAWTIIGGIIGFILGIVGMIFGIISLKKARSGMGVAGLVLSIIGMVLCLVVVAIMGCAVGLLVGNNSIIAKENGILTQAENAREETKKAEIQDRISVAYSSAYSEYLLASYGYSYGSSKTLTDYFKEALEEQFEDENYYYSVYGSDTYGWTVYVDGNSYSVSSSGQVTIN